MRNLVQLPRELSESKIQIMRTGKWKHPKYGDLTITPDSLHRMKENFDNNVRGVKLFVDKNHDKNHVAYGEFKNLEVQGNKLFADVDWNEEGEKLIKSGQYNYFSPEFFSKYKDDESGKEFRDVLTGGALTNRPFLKGMEPVQLSELEEDGIVMLYDPDGDGDNDNVADPKENPDWKQDILAGITPWDAATPQQQAELIEVGACREACNAAYAVQHDINLEDVENGLMFDDSVKNAHKSPPKGKPKDRSEYADPEHYKYPIDKSHIKAAVSYFNHDGEREKGGYSKEQWSKIGHRIASAASKLEGGHYEYKDGKVITPSEEKSMTENADEKAEKKPSDGIGESKPHKIDDADAGDYHEHEGGMEMTEEVKQLQEDYKNMSMKFEELQKENRRMKLSERVDGLVYDKEAKVGHLAPAQRDGVLEFMEGLDDEQVKKFEDIMSQSPAVIQYGETGFAGKNTEKTDPLVMLAEKTAKHMKDGKSMSEAHELAEQEIEAMQMKEGE